MVLKLDISKAYDRINWNFLFKVLKAMGFGNKLIKLIGECISIVTYIVLLNGSPLEKFRASRGLRQGDPLSPYLFIILVEVLASNLNSMVRRGALLGIKPASMMPPNVLHQFDDETILFGISSVWEAKAWKSFLDTYALAYGQHINYEKSSIYCFHTNVQLQDKVCKFLGCQRASLPGTYLPGTYLGLPLTVKDVSNFFWISILERMQKKLVGWKGRFLSSVGKLQLLSSSLHGIPMYFLSLFKISAAMAAKLENIQKTFLWMGMEEKKRLTLVGWDKVCLPKAMGGLGTRKISRFNKALMTKIAWKLLNKDTDWSRIIRARYLGNGDFSSVLKEEGLPRGSKIWNNILSYREPLSHGLRWLIGNGKKILLWEDCWIGERPLASSPSLRRLQDATKGFFGERVSDYFSNRTWRALEDYCIDHPFLLPTAKELQKLLAGIFLPLFPREDKFIWKWDPSGDFSVRTAYTSLLRELVYSSIWKEVWNPQLIPKVNFF
ncbi:hypothetical protein SUGI_0914210 [Cryptomeria japonica]|nr:hypothetical protein SUGI_0914210 [Cryptomeria japonica]